MSRKILVTGGSGFLGSEVCRIAEDLGHEVTSISRHGKPDHGQPWMESVRWVTANILDPDSYREYLQGCDAIIHCIGTLKEKRSAGITHERFNRDAAIMAAWEAEHAGVKRFVLVSASKNFPLLSNRFVQAKRSAEASLRGRNIRESILRAPLIFGDNRPATKFAAGVINGVDRLPVVSRVARRFHPLHVDQVALAAIRAATEDGYEGVIDVKNIEYLAGDRWTKYAGAPEPKADRSLVPVLITGTVIVATAAIAWPIVQKKYSTHSERTSFLPFRKRKS